MREIKFRARIKGGFLHDLWVYSTGFYFDDVNYWVLQPAKDNHAIAFADQAIVDPDTLGQFTGRHDRDGSEIYEGDMVLFTWWWFDGQERDSELTGTIVYSEENMSFQLKGVKNAEWERFMGFENDREYLTPFSELMFEDADFRVVGNIHDNPELLTIGGKE